jgi:hypothetical protein
MGIKTHKFVVLAAIVPRHKKSPLAWGQRACLGGGWVSFAGGPRAVADSAKNL